MGSGFYGLEIAKTGLFTAQRAMDVLGHNIANANTVGYTRQRLITTAIDPYAADTRYALMENGVLGAGVNVAVLDQVRNTYIDREYRGQNADLGQWSVRADEMEFIERMMNETSDSGISQTMADFFNSIQELSKDPANQEIRVNVQQNALKMTDTFNYFATQLIDIQHLQNDNMNTTVIKINDIASNIAAYNKQITAFELTGDKANDLRDKRNVLLDDLSKLVNIDYTESSQGLVVTVEGAELVNNTAYNRLITVPNQTGVVTGETGFYSIQWEATGTAFKYSSGELEGYRVLRDGNTVTEIGVPRILGNLDTLVRSMAQQFNTVHATGYTLPYGSTLSQTGLNFFNVPGGNYANVTCKTFELSSNILDHVENIAASDALVDLTANNDQRGNNKIALKMVDLTNSANIPGINGFEPFLSSTVVEVGIQSSHCIAMTESQEALVNNLLNRRESVSGVSIDEEMTDMVRFQHAYSAAARMITTIDEALDTLINRTGMVGR